MDLLCSVSHEGLDDHGPMARALFHSPQYFGDDFPGKEGPASEALAHPANELDVFGASKGHHQSVDIIQAQLAMGRCAPLRNCAPMAWGPALPIGIDIPQIVSSICPSSEIARLHPPGVPRWNDPSLR